MKKVKRTKEYFDLILACVKRAEKEGLAYLDRISMEMDLECADNNVGLDFNKLLSFDKFNFAHDICGIRNNINRATAKIENCFLPRCARR
jgi:hypothetical protein